MHKYVGASLQIVDTGNCLLLILRSFIAVAVLVYLIKSEQYKKKMKKIKGLSRGAGQKRKGEQGTVGQDKILIFWSGLRFGVTLFLKVQKHKAMVH
jgi:hypothetical protein